MNAIKLMKYKIGNKLIKAYSANLISVVIWGGFTFEPDFEICSVSLRGRRHFRWGKQHEQGHGVNTVTI